MGVTRVDRLADDERARMDAHADRWIDIGLRTGDADRERFERAVESCYRYAGIDWPDVVVWVPSPLVLALAAPAAALAIELVESARRPGAPLAVDGAVRDAVNGAVDGAVRGAVNGAVSGAVRDAVDEAVGDAVDGAVRGAAHGAVDGAARGAVDGAVDEAAHGAVHGAVRGAVRGAVDGAVDEAVGDAVGGAVRGAVGDAVGGAVNGAVSQAVSRGWPYYIGGQFWAGWGFYYGAAYTSFFREVCNLELKGDLWDRGRAYEATVESACWWWPHRRFVMVCERPLEIHRELVDETRPRGWGSHRLHRDDGPSVVWPDGWGVWAIHGARVPQQVVEAPETLTVDQINGEMNAEVRRVMVDRFGAERYLREADAKLVDDDPEWGKLWRLDQSDDEPLVMVSCVNSTPEPDGSGFKTYWLRVPPDTATARQALGWTFNVEEEGYAPAIET